MDFHGMNRKVLQSLCKTYGIQANLKNNEMASRLASFFKADGIKENFKLMERRDLQTMCKKYGIPANLKNNEMATRLASLFQETLICTDLKEHSYVDNLAKVEEILENSDECCEEDEESSLEKEIQIASLAVNFSEKEMEISNPESVLFAETTPPPSSVQLVVSSSESVLFVETTPPPPPVQLAVRNSESDLRVPTGHTIVKDIVPAVIAEEDIITSKEVPRSVHSFGAKLSEAEAVLEISAECWNQSLSSKDDERGPLDSEMQSENPHGNFSDCNTVKSFVEEQADICEVGCISAGYCVNQETLDAVKNDSLTKAELIISNERDCKLNVLELSGSLSTDFASLSPKEETVSECLEEAEMKALSQPIPTHKVASNAIDRLSLFTTPERCLMLMEQLSEFGKIRAADTLTHHNEAAAESHAIVFTTREQVLLLGDSELYEVGKEEEHIDTDFPDESDVLSTSENEGESIVVELHDEPNIAASPLPHTAGNQERKEVEFNYESAFFTRLESRLLLGKSGQDSLGNGKSGSTHYQSHHASSPKVTVKDDSMVPVCHVAAPDFIENTIADSSGNTQKVSYSHEFNAEEETAVEEEKAMSLTPNEVTVQDNRHEEGLELEAAQGTSKQSRLHSPHVNSVNLPDFDTEEGTEITVEADRNVTLISYVIALPDEGDSETVSEISSQLDVGGTCSMISEESVPYTDIQNQINDELDELAVTDNNETDELIEAKATKNMDSFGQTCVLAGTEDQHFDYSSEVDFKNAEESGHKILKDEATDPIATAFAADEEMVKREVPLSPEETLNESAEKECADIGESGTLSEKQVIREPNLIYRTQVKPKRQDMKENAPSSKIVEKLNVTALRTYKRQPLQDLRNIREEPNTVFKPTQIWKPKTFQPKHKTCNKEVSLLSTAQHIHTGNRFAVLSDYDDC